MERAMLLVKKYPIIFELLAIFIVIIPASITLVSPGYPTMHDDQHVARLFVFDQALMQGYFYPRWAELFGFNYGYPLFNFYPPLMYFIGEIIHFFGFGFATSIKGVIICGFFACAWGSYIFLKELYNRWAGFLGAVFVTYFLYHSTLVYVRGAIAEFIALACIPFIFHSFFLLYKKPEIRTICYAALSIAAIMLAHPLIAFPFMMYLGMYGLLLLYLSKEKVLFAVYGISSVLLGFAASAFFWLPSLIEKKYTLVDAILTKELASYSIHFVDPIQFIFSPWGFGGSGAGLADNMSFQLGKFYIVVFAVMCAVFILQKFKNLSPVSRRLLPFLYFFVATTLFGIFMTTEYSKGIWNGIQFLSYLQFPWRFYTFITFTIACALGLGISILVDSYIPKKHSKLKFVFICVLALFTIISNIRYFEPQEYRNLNDTNLTSFTDITERVSRSSFEFVPSGVKTTKSIYNTTVLDIANVNVVRAPYVDNPDVQVKVLKSLYQEKVFTVTSQQETLFTINTFNFPGWKVYLKQDGIVKPLTISDANDYKLVEVMLPRGSYELIVRFEDTLVRIIANVLSILSFLFALIMLIPWNKVLARKLK
jgi:hypothetical protein